MLAVAVAVRPVGAFGAIPADTISNSALLETDPVNTPVVAFLGGFVVQGLAAFVGDGRDLPA